jgi:hypothetical protein
MDKILNAIGNLLALSGILICAITVLTRLAGSYYLAGFELKVWFLVGVGLMVAAALAKLQVLIIRTKP